MFERSWNGFWDKPGQGLKKGFLFILAIVVVASCFIVPLLGLADAVFRTSLYEKYQDRLDRNWKVLETISFLEVVGNILLLICIFTPSILGMIALIPCLPLKVIDLMVGTKLASAHRRKVDETWSWFEDRLELI